VGRRDRPYKTEVVDIGAGDHVFAAPHVTAIYCNATGTVSAKMRGDSAFLPYQVFPGKELLGDWVAVEKAGTSLTNANDMIGLINEPDD